MLTTSIRMMRSKSQALVRSPGSARLQLLSAVALGAFLVSAAPAWAKESGAGCQNLGAAQIQQGAAASKCDPIKVPNIGHVTVTETSVGDDPMVLDDAPSQPDGEPKKGSGKGGGKGGGNGPVEEADQDPEGEPQKGGGSEVAEDGGGGTGKGKKKPGLDQVDKHPVGDIDHPDKVIVEKNPGDKGGKNGGGKGGGGGSGTPDDPIIAIAEEVEDIAVAEPDKPKIAIAEEVEDIAIAEPEPDYVPAKPKVKHKNGNPAGDEDDGKVLSLEEPEDNIKTLEEPEDIVKHFEEPKDNVKAFEKPEEKVLFLKDEQVVLGLKPVAPTSSSDQLKLTAGKKSDAPAKKTSPSADKSDRPGKDSKGGRDKGGRDKGGKADGGGRRR